MPLDRIQACRQPECETRIFLAYRPGRGWRPFDAKDVPAFTQQASDAFVIVGDQAWKPLELIEEFQTSRELSEPDARALVAEYPFHRLHLHPRPEPEEGITT